MSEIEFSISDKDIISIMQENHNAQIMNTVDKLIEYCRHKEKEFLADKSEHSGSEFLHQLASNGTLPPYLYLKIKECIDNPDAPYKININHNQ